MRNISIFPFRPTPPEGINAYRRHAVCVPRYANFSLVQQSKGPKVNLPLSYRAEACRKVGDSSNKSPEIEL